MKAQWENNSTYTSDFNPFFVIQKEYLHLNIELLKTPVFSRPGGTTSDFLEV
jgi:hypothetical protein